MSYDMRLETGEGVVVAEMNWLRNPYGLLPWLEANVGDPNRELYHALNDPTYDKSDTINREHVLRLVADRAAKVSRLQEGVFRMSYDWDVGYAWTVRMLVEQGRLLPSHVRIVGCRGEKVSRWKPEGVTVYVKVNMDALSEVGGRHRILRCRNVKNLHAYKEWVAELLAFATALQDPKLKFYASN